MTTTTRPATCTMTTGHDRRCGKPAVASFVGIISGATFHECAEHRSRPLPPITKPALKRCYRKACIDLMSGPHHTIDHR